MSASPRTPVYIDMSSSDVNKENVSTQDTDMRTMTELRSVDGLSHAWNTPSRAAVVWNREQISAKTPLQEKLNSLKKRLTDEEIALSAEYTVGNLTYLKIVALKEKRNGIHDSIIVLMSSGKNEISMKARYFIEHVIPIINSAVTNASTDSEIYPFGNYIRTQVYKEDKCTWLLWRSYTEGMLVERLYMDSNTWRQIQSLQPILEATLQQYSMAYLRGHFDDPASEELDSIDLNNSLDNGSNN